jgi:Right handed beta helix region
MRTRHYAVAAVSLASALAVAAGFWAGTATASPPLRVPAITPTPLNACGPIVTPGSYVLTANPAPTVSCFVISAPHVTLDLAGHVIAGLGVGTGIAVAPGALDVKIETSLPGAVIGGFGTGIRDNGNGALIAGPGLLITGNTVNGVWVNGAAGSSVNDVSVNGNHHYGIHLQLSAGVSLSADQVKGSGTYGIWDETSEGSQIVNNLVAGSHGAGIYLGCSATGNLQDFNCGRPSDKSLITQDILLANGDYGIAIADESLGNNVVTNHASGDLANDLQDENFHCTGPTGTNSWQGDTGTRNQSISPSCIG